MPIVRIGLGATVSALGIFLFLAGRPFSGSTLGIIGIVIGLRRERRPVLVFFTGIAFFWFGVGLLYGYYAVIENDTRTIAEWIRDNWVGCVGFGIVTISLMSRFTEDSESSWFGLEQDYADIGDFVPDGAMISTEGNGVIGGTTFELVVCPSEAGIVVGRKSGRSVLFRWEKLSELCSLNAEGDRVFAVVSRNLPTRLELELPWDPKFWNHVPSDVRDNDT